MQDLQTVFLMMIMLNRYVKHYPTVLTWETRTMFSPLMNNESCPHMVHQLTFITWKQLSLIMQMLMVKHLSDSCKALATYCILHT